MSRSAAARWSMVLPMLGLLGVIALGFVALLVYAAISR